MLYELAGSSDNGECNHLPALHALVWGRYRHSSLATFLRQSNTVDVASDYVDLVYSYGNPDHPRKAFYKIISTSAIDASWGRTAHTAANPAHSPDLTALKSSLRLTLYRVITPRPLRSQCIRIQFDPEHDKELVAEGKASKVIVLTTPSEADIYIDGKKRWQDADRVLSLQA
jgi:hypothetical protein